MNKTDLIKNISEISGLSQEDSLRALNGLTTSIIDELRNGNFVQIVGFGTFSVVERAERIGMNLQTRNQMVIPAKKVAKWKPSKNLLAE